MGIGRRAWKVVLLVRCVVERCALLHRKFLWFLLHVTKIPSGVWTLSVCALRGSPGWGILRLLIVSLWNHPAACCPMTVHACSRTPVLHTITQWGRRLAMGRGQVSFQHGSHFSSALVMVHSRKLAVWLLTQITFLFSLLDCWQV